MDKKLQKTVRKVNKSIDSGETVPLKQPAPNELSNLTPSDTTGPQPPKQNTDSRKQENQEKPQKTEPTIVAGFPAEELIKAPVQPPNLARTDSYHATANTKVRFLILIGIALFVIGIIFMLVLSILIGLLIALLGAIAIAVSVLAPIK